MHIAIQTPLCALPCRPLVHRICRQHVSARFSHVAEASGSQSKVAESAKGSEGKVKNLRTSYCNDFQCTSSPAVGNTIKSFAKDIERGKSWTMSLFAERVVYKGGARSFTGKSKYQRLYWARENLTDYKTQVLSMEMVGQDTANVKWKFSGQLGPLPLKGSVTSTIVLNPLTGQIVQHTDNYSFSDSDPVARMAASAQRLAWASKQNAKDTQESLDTALDSLSSIDEGEVYNADPTNPNKFFQQRDNTFQDAVLYATFLAILWGLWQAYAKLYTM